MKHYKYGDRVMTADEAKAAAPNPRFFDRATDKLTKEQALAILRRNIDEMQFWLNQDKALAEGRVAGRVTKHSVILAANRLHDWRTSMNILSGGFGQPYMWEVDGEPLANPLANHAETSSSPIATVHDPYDTPGIEWHCRHPPVKGSSLYAEPGPCPTCEALARTVLMDQTGRA